MNEFDEMEGLIKSLKTEMAGMKAMLMKMHNDYLNGKINEETFSNILDLTMKRKEQIEQILDMTVDDFLARKKRLAEALKEYEESKAENGRLKSELADLQAKYKDLSAEGEILLGRMRACLKPIQEGAANDEE